MTFHLPSPSRVPLPICVISFLHSPVASMCPIGSTAQKSIGVGITCSEESWYLRSFFSATAITYLDCMDCQIDTPQIRVI
ncbi:hypothetical protein F5Y16DRAFT_350640 [Xylariaceae sp. FL0255]|nr:hypothetical protein F5Y16DRAFT_350640 [Xylariaceae sp. FL0255]